MKYGRTGNCVRRRKNALLIQFGVEIVWDNVDCTNGTWDPADFAGPDDITTNLAKGRKPGDIERVKPWPTRMTLVLPKTRTSHSTNMLHLLVYLVLTIPPRFEP